jgi:hypothetical protein
MSIGSTDKKILTGKTAALKDKTVPVPISPPQIPHALSWEQTQAPSVKATN